MPSRLVILVLWLALLAAACSDSTTITTGTEAPSTVTTDPAGSIVFGSGSVPETMPGGFPIPEAAVIGSTLIDRDRGLTEMVMRAKADVTALTAFFETNLPVRGFTVDSSREEGDGRKIEFSGDDGSGTVDVTAAGQGVSQALITFIDGS